MAKRREASATSPSPFRCTLTPQRVSHMNHAQNVLDRHHGREPLMPSYDLFLLRYAEEDRNEQRLVVVRQEAPDTVTHNGLTLKWPNPRSRKH